MDLFRFRTYLSSNIRISDELAQVFLSECNSIQVAQGGFLLQAGGKISHSFFVERGLLRQYSIDAKGKEHIIQFAPENWFMADRESEFLDRPSSYFIEAVEDSQVLVIEQSLIQRLSKSNAEFMKFNTSLLHRHITSLQKRITLLQSASVRERYLDFVKTYPDLLLRIPQTYVASYLGVTPEGLSRVRKEMAQGH